MSSFAEEFRCVAAAITLGTTSAASAQSALPPAPPASTPSQELPSVRVTGQAVVDPDRLPPPFSGGQVARGARLGILGNVDVLTAPFSIKSITSQTIQDQGARNVDDVVLNDPSIRVSLSPGFVLDQSSIRGLVVSSSAYRIDGFPGMLSYVRVPVQNYERVEILKGPATGVYGASAGSFSVGGVINLVPKRATVAPSDSVTVGFESRSLAVVHADVGRRFGVDNALGIRFNVVGEKGDLSNTTERKSIAPQIAIDFASDRFRASYDAWYNDYENRRPGVNHSVALDQPVPKPPEGKRASQPDFAQQALKTHFQIVGTELDILRQVTAYAKYGRAFEKSDESVLGVIGPLRGDGTFTVSNVSYNTWQTENKVAEGGVRASFATGPISHQLTLSTLRYDSHYRTPVGGQSQFSGTPFIPVQGSIYDDYEVTDPFNGGYPSVGRYNVGPPVIQTSYGFADSMQALDERLNIVAGFRHQRIKQDPYSGRRNTPTIAASYQLGGGLTVYGNYAESLLQGSRAQPPATNAGRDLPPYVADQKEVGVKWGAGTYAITFAYFRIAQETAFLDPADNVFKSAGRQRNQGLELETFGEVARGVRLLGGVAFIDGKQTKTAGGVTDGKRALGVSRWNVNLGSEFDVGAVPGLTATARAIYTDSAYVNLANTQQIPSWTRFDLGARYRTTVAGNDVALRVSVNNVLDRNHWQSGGRNIFVAAEPRTWQVSASLAF